MQTAANTARNPLQTLVGYSNKSIKGSTFVLYGVPWQGVDGKLDLNTLVKGLTTEAEIDWTQMLIDGDINPYIGNAPQIQIMKSVGTGYDTFYYVKNAAKTFDENLGIISECATGWCDVSGALIGSGLEIVPGDLTPGTCVWFKDLGVSEAAYTTPVTSGAVINEEHDIETPADFKLRGPMLPMPFGLNDASLVTYSEIYADSEIDWTQMLIDGDINPYIQNAPQIQIMKSVGTGYDTFYYVKNAAKTFDENLGIISECATGWCDVSGALIGSGLEIVPGIVPVNAGFWAKGVKQSFTMTFKPLAK